MYTFAKAAAAVGSVVAVAGLAVALHGQLDGTAPRAASTREVIVVHVAGQHQSGTTAGTAAGTQPSTGAGTGTSSTSTSTAGGTGAAGQGTGSGSTGTSAGAGTPPGQVVSVGHGVSKNGDTGTITSTGGTTSTSTGTPGVHLPALIIAKLPHVLTQTVTALPSPSGTIGDPGVPCLEGYVWRQAYAGDYVCVTPANRSQAAADNAAAVSRVQQGGGAYGQYTCGQGYVWRQVVPDDYTCVTPAVRSQAADDNAQVNNRVALFSLWVTDWTPPSSNTTTCSGDVCTTTEGGGDGPNFQVNGDHFNFGQVQLQIRSAATGALLWWTNVTAGSYPGYPGGAFGAHTPFTDCSAVPGSHNDDYVVGYDLTSGRWSNQLPINSDCASL